MAKDKLTAEMIKGYHEMAKIAMGQAQEIIDELRSGIDDEDVSLVKGIQTGLDHAAHVLWILRDRGVTIDPTILREFDILNQNIVALNNANHQTLVQTREIGDVTEMPGNVVATTGNGHHAVNNTTHGEDNHGHGHYHAMGEDHPLVGAHQDSGCCSSCIVM